MPNDTEAAPRVAGLVPHPGNCCADSGRHPHHDRLLAVEIDINELLELIELAVTWGELDYSGTPVIPPEQWIDFAARHHWRDPERAMRIFSLATDIALRSQAHCARDDHRARRELAAAGLGILGAGAS